MKIILDCSEYKDVHEMPLLVSEIHHFEAGSNMSMLTHHNISVAISRELFESTRRLFPGEVEWKTLQGYPFVIKDEEAKK